MQNTPEVSVIVPSYNHGRYLPKRFDSILAQSFTNFELIVLDDCSTDNSREIIAEYRSRFPDMQVRFNKENTGSPYVQWHSGIAVARGKYIWVAESDDFAEPQFLETLMGYIEKEPQASVAMCRSFKTGHNDQNLGLVPGEGIFPHDALFNSDFVMPGELFVPEYLSAHSCMPNASAILFRRADYLACGGVDTSMCLSGDWLLWGKLLKGRALVYTAQCLNHFRVAHGGSPRLSRETAALEEWVSTFRWIASQYELQEKHWSSSLNHFAQMWGEFLWRALRNGNIRAAMRSTKTAVALSPSIPLRAARRLLAWWGKLPASQDSNN